MDAAPEFSPGDYIEVVICRDEDPLPPGATGVVTRWSGNPSVRQLDVDWDAPHQHRSLMLDLTPGGDVVRRLSNLEAR